MQGAFRAFHSLYFEDVHGPWTTKTKRFNGSSAAFKPTKRFELCSVEVFTVQMGWLIDHESLTMYHLPKSIRITSHDR